jgi:adenylate kinase family enzyme
MKIILLYGPPSSGKGTHARLLEEYGGYKLLEPAHIFRQIAADTTHPLSKDIAHTINNGYPVTSKQYKDIVGSKLHELLKTNTSFVLDKPGGSRLNEAKWFLELVEQYKPEIYLFVLHIPLLESLRRIDARYFITSSGESYISYKEALAHCPKAEIPVKRVDDLDTTKVRRRYRLLYQTKHKAIEQLYREHGAHVMLLDGMEDVLTVQAQLRQAIS